MQEIQRVLAHWSAAHRGAAVERVRSPQSFSEADVWRIQTDGQEFALRRWQESMDANRVAQIHRYQSSLAAGGLTFIPVLQRTTEGGTTLVENGGRLWELASWMPGVADFRRDPSAARLQAAMQAIARV